MQAAHGTALAGAEALTEAQAFLAEHGGEAPEAEDEEEL